MDRHALAVLELADSWMWPESSRRQFSANQGSKLKAIMPKLLSCFIEESQALGGTVLDQFWVEVGECDTRLTENIEILRGREFSSPGDSETVLFEGVDRETINFSPIFKMGEELFTHLGIAFMTPGGCKPGSGTPLSVNDLLAKDTDELLRMAASEGVGTREQAALKILMFKRDGSACPLTGAPFKPSITDGVVPRLVHIIPNSVYDKPDTMKSIAMFTGTAVCDIVVEQSKSLGNLMNIEANAHDSYYNSAWGIEAREEDGKVKYIYRSLPYSTGTGPGFIRLRDGDEIVFGGGLEATKLGSGPNPTLCNLQLAVARVLKMSGAVEVIGQIIEDGDDSDFPHVFIAAPAFRDILTAQLQLAGGVLLDRTYDGPC